MNETLIFTAQERSLSAGDWGLIRHKLLFESGFSEGKLKFAIGKAQLQFYGRKYLGERGYSMVGVPFERVTDFAFKLMR